MSDLIERQAAIDVIRAMQTYKLFAGDELILVDKAGVMTELMMLPPAQTEIITCKDCYWWTKQEYSLQGRCDRYGMYPTGYWYCAGARERRTDE